MSASIVDRIAVEEKAHVAVGVYWFRQVSRRLGIDPGSEFRSWAHHLNPDALKGPFNHAARELVGMDRSWCVLYWGHLSWSGCCMHSRRYHSLRYASVSHLDALSCSCVYMRAGMTRHSGARETRGLRRRPGVLCGIGCSCGTALLQ